MSGHPFITAKEFFEELNAANQTAPMTHHLSPGLTDNEFSQWSIIHKGHHLPKDLLDLLRVHNGFRVWNDESTPSGGYFVLLPLSEIRHAPFIMYGGNRDLDDEFPQSVMCVSDTPDSDFFILLDLSNGNYYEIDPIEPFQDARFVAASTNELLSWVKEQFVDCSPYEDDDE